MKRVIVYVPGLGDKRKTLIWLQKQSFKTWAIGRFHIQVFAIQWTGDTEFKARLSELITLIDSLVKNGKQVSLIGSSAGASAVVNAYAQRPDTVHAVICVCGALRGTESFPEAIFKLNPRFEESAEILKTSIASLSPDQKQRILTLRPIIDAIVLPKNAQLPGATNKRLVSFGHLFSIGYFLNAKGRLIRRFIRKQQNHSS